MLFPSLFHRRADYLFFLELMGELEGMWEQLRAIRRPKNESGMPRFECEMEGLRGLNEIC